ncbi:hypothetical protein GEMRC1_007501 [Eukaryota sp. GEM-RC1]
MPSSGSPEELTPYTTCSQDQNGCVSDFFSFTYDHVYKVLCSFQQAYILTDTVIVYGSIKFHCHSSIITPFSSVLKEKLLQSSTLELSSMSSDIDSELLLSVLNTFYGHSLPISTQSVPMFSFIASLLQYHELNDFLDDRMSNGLKHLDSNNFKLDPKTCISKFVESCPHDVRVSYKNTDIMMNSLNLTLFSRTFLTSSSQTCTNSSVKRFQYFDEFPGVSEDNLVAFFNLFHYQAIKLNFLNLLDFLQLSKYFQVDQLQLTCEQFLASNRFSETELIYILKISNQRYLYKFVENNIEIFKNLSHICEYPIPLRISFIILLLPFIDVVWLFRCLMKLHKVDPFSPSELSEILFSLVISDSECSQIFEILKPLFNIHSLLQF